MRALFSVPNAVVLFTRYWVRWMLVSEDIDAPVVHVARGAPRRWYFEQSEAFGITDAPTRFGKVTYSMNSEAAGHGDGDGGGSVVRGFVRLEERAGVVKGPVFMTIKLRAADAASPLQGVVDLVGDGVQLVAWHAGNETAVISSARPSASFNFTAK